MARFQDQVRELHKISREAKLRQISREAELQGFKRGKITPDIKREAEFQDISG